MLFVLSKVQTQGEAKGLYFMSETGNSAPTDKPEANGVLSLQGHPTTVFCKNLFGEAKLA